MHNPVFIFVLKDYISADGIQRVVDFLDAIKLSPKGEALIISVIIYAKEKGKRLAEIFAVIKKEQEANWRLQDPKVRGDPDVASAFAEQNRVSLQAICHFLGISNPNEGENKIPKDSLMVQTIEKVIYRFGPANEEDERTVTRDGDPLKFSKCKIVFLSSGRRMVLFILDPDGVWRTSTIAFMAFG